MSSSRLLLLFMNLKYHVARDAISTLIDAPNVAAAHRDALGRGQVRAELHNPIKLLIASITTVIVWISVLIGTAIKKLIGLLGWAISIVIRIVQEGNGAGVVVGDEAVGGELVEDA